MKNLTTQKKLFYFLLISPALVVSSQAAVFNINCDDVAQLINAINIANTNSDADEINLNADDQINCVYQLTAVNNKKNGANGLPSIISPITINGHQSAIQRRGGSERFRIFHVASTGNLTLKQLSVENGLNDLNGSGDWHGGGIFNRGELTLKQSKVSGNTADYFGGGIFNLLGKLTLKQSKISGNTAWKGSGIFNSDDCFSVSATAIIANSTVSENTGGGIFNECSIVILTNSTISENKNNGGIVNNWYSTTTLINSTVAGNTSESGDGGGISNWVSTAVLTNSSVVGNTVTNWDGSNWSSGGIYNGYQSTTMLKNTILAGNVLTGDMVTTSNCFNEVNSIINADHYNLFSGDGMECNAGMTDLTLAAFGISITDVLKQTLANNGGSTKTLALIANSPAIDAADDAICPATDQRGVSRPQGAKCDIGAFEYQEPALLELNNFQAIATSQGIYLKWITTSASDNAGFRLWRANLDQYGRYTNVTVLDNPQAQTLSATPLDTFTNGGHLIAAGNSAECYSYLDANATQAGTTYFYLLEDINMGGYQTWHWDNLVSATVGQNSGGNPQCEDK
jgi:hypothetical protein